MELKDIGGVAIAIVIAIVIIAMGAQLLTEVETSSYEGLSVSNETHVVTDTEVAENFALDYAGKYVGSLSVSAVYSNDTISLCPTSNYTVNTGNMSVTIAALASADQGCNCSDDGPNYGCAVYYSYQASTSASNASSQGSRSMTTLGNWMPTIAIVLAAAIIIGIIVNSFRT